MADVNNPNWMNEIDFVDEKERLLFAKAQLGDQVREFLVSPAGRYLHGRAKEALEEARDEALDIKPWSPFARRQQTRVREKAAHARNFMSWCVDAIMEGEAAFEQLKEYRHE